MISALTNHGCARRSENPHRPAYPQKRRLRVFVIGAGAFLTLLIGVSRMYLGVHYPTDVLAGWTAGLIWALVCGLVIRKLGKRGAVPTPHAEGDTEAGGDTSVQSDQHK